VLKPGALDTTCTALKDRSIARLNTGWMLLEACACSLDILERKKTCGTTKRVWLVKCERGCPGPKGLCPQSRRDSPIVAWHEVPGKRHLKRAVP